MSLADELPSDFDGKGMIERFGSMEDLAKSFVETKRTLSGKVDDYAGSMLSNDQRKSIARSLAPDSEDGLSLPEGLDESTAASVSKVREKAHELGLTSDQWSGVVDTFLGAQDGAMKSHVETTEAAAEAWKQQAMQEYGAKFDEVHAEAKRVFDKMTSENPEVGKILQATGLGSHPAMLQMFHQVANLTAPGGTPLGMSGEQGSDAQTKAFRVQEIMSMEEFTDKRNPRRKALLHEFNKLNGELVEAGFSGGAYDKKLEKEY